MSYLDRKSTLILFVCGLTAAITHGIQIQMPANLPGASRQAYRFMAQHPDQEVTSYK